MEILLFASCIALVIVFLWKLSGIMFAKKKDEHARCVKSTTLSGVKMISLPECDYKEMEDTIEEQKAMINDLSRQRRSLIDSLLLDNAHKAAKMSRSESKDLLRKSKDIDQHVFEQTHHGPVLFREDNCD